MRGFGGFLRGLLGGAPGDSQLDAAVAFGEPESEFLRRVKSAQAEERLALDDVWRDFYLVFPTYCGEPQRPSAFSSRFHTLAESIGLGDVRFHDLRHAHASALLRQMVSPHIVQRRLVRSDPVFTLRVYADVLPGQLREAADGFAEAVRSARDAG